jgi:capsular polysaccharide export protein
MTGPETVDYEGLWAVRSPGVMVQTPRLREFMGPGANFVFVPPGLTPPRQARGLAGWGLIGKAHLEARQRGLTYLALEDGFLRSAGLTGPGGRRLSLVADPDGIYYDCSRPSRLERLIQNWRSIPQESLEEAEALMAIIARDNLGKYNAASDVAEDDPDFRGEAPVIVLDQIAGDRSIAGGGCSPRNFAEMLEAAVAENPGRQVLARVHPMEGKRGKSGHLRPLAAARNIRVYDANVSWASLARRAHRVYVASSQAGLEALIVGTPVTCFGMPAYGGWGLTDDRSACERRTERPPLAALVAAAFIQYPINIDPVTNRPCDSLRIARIISASRRRDRETEGLSHVVGVQRWKRPAVLPFLKGERSTLTWTMSPAVALQRQKREGGRIVRWASHIDDQFAARAQGQGATLVRLEDGFLRSVGLGSRREPPSSLVTDDIGIYYDPASPSRLEQILQAGDMDSATLQQAAALRDQLIRMRLSKYNVGGVHRQGAFAGAKGRLRILVPGQVADDASVRRGSGHEVKDNLTLLRAVRAQRPDAFIVYKPHPDVEAGLRPGALTDAETGPLADGLALDWAITDLLDECDELHTLTSLSGFEALMRGIAVHTYGRPFYAGWGLTQDQLTIPRRTRTVTLDELTAAALLLYPRYVDRRTGRPVEATDVMATFAARGRPGN